LGSVTGGLEGGLPPTSIPPIRAKDSMAWFIFDTFIGGVSQTRLKTNRPLDQETRAAYRGLHPLSRQRVDKNHAPELAKYKENHPNPDEFRPRTIAVFLAA
jgi:hypothetical protein